MLCTSLLLFNFQGSFRLRLFAATLLLYHIPYGLSSTFWKFFQLFSSFFPHRLRYSAPRSRGQLAYYIILGKECQALFWIFFCFFVVLSLCPVFSVNLYDIVGRKSTYSTKALFDSPKQGSQFWWNRSKKSKFSEYGFGCGVGCQPIKRVIDWFFVVKARQTNSVQALPRQLHKPCCR